MAEEFRIVLRNTGKIDPGELTTTLKQVVTSLGKKP